MSVACYHYRSLSWQFLDILPAIIWTHVTFIPCILSTEHGPCVASSECNYGVDTLYIREGQSSEQIEAVTVTAGHQMLSSEKSNPLRRCVSTNACTRPDVSSQSNCHAPFQKLFIARKAHSAEKIETCDTDISNQTIHAHCICEYSRH